MDEVGRGAIAGPVSVGVVVIDDVCRSAPVGVKDSKLLSHQMRERMVPKIRAWATACAVGHASPAEIDKYGIMVALRLAGTRALNVLAGRSVIPDLVLLDGNQDWLTDPRQVGLLGILEREPLQDPGDTRVPAMTGVPGGAGFPDGTSLPVRTMVKADLFCSSVAAASVLAKVERDALMVALAAQVPDYAWELNKGYCAPEHVAALQSHGPSLHHRRSWRLPGVDSLDGPADPQSSGVVTVVGDALMDDDGGVRAELRGIQ
jgi:ribonuclease HII